MRGAGRQLGTHAGRTQLAAHLSAADGRSPPEEQGALHTLWAIEPVSAWGEDGGMAREGELGQGLKGADLLKDQGVPWARRLPWEGVDQALAARPIDLGLGDDAAITEHVEHPQCMCPAWAGFDGLSAPLRVGQSQAVLACSCVPALLNIKLRDGVEGRDEQGKDQRRRCSHFLAQAAAAQHKELNHWHQRGPGAATGGHAHQGPALLCADSEVLDDVNADLQVKADDERRASEAEQGGPARVLGGRASQERTGASELGQQRQYRQDARGLPALPEVPSPH